MKRGSRLWLSFYLIRAVIESKLPMPDKNRRSREFEAFILDEAERVRYFTADTAPSDASVHYRMAILQLERTIKDRRERMGGKQ